MSDSPDIRANKEKEAGKRKKGQATDQHKFGVDVPNSEDEQLGHEKWAGGENISLPVDWEDNIKKGKTSKDTYDSFITEAKKLICPEPTQDLELNTKNRNAAIKADYIQYGPLNLTDEEYWERAAEHWNTEPEVAKESKCYNCVAFDISPNMQDCMPGSIMKQEVIEIAIENNKPWETLGYCWMHSFKCHSDRTCYTWAAGGPITEDKISADWQEKNTSIKENIKNEKTSKDIGNTAITETFLRHVIQIILTEKRDPTGGSYYDETYQTGTIKNLHLDKPIKALPSTHKRVNGKDVPVNKQIIDYLRDMGLLV